MTSPRLPKDQSTAPDQQAMESTVPLRLVHDLSSGFREAGVEFCHWKSNAALSLSEAGVNDLDLLVAERDAELARRVLDDLGFVRAAVPRSRRVPGLTDYFGVDTGSGRLVQVQLHESLVLGDDMTKNFRLPVESAYLASSRLESLLPVPSPEFEYVVFVLRMALKHCPLDAVIMGKGRLTRTEQRELEYLEERVDHDELERILADEFPWLSLGELDHLRGGLDQNASIRMRAQRGRRVIGLLAPFRRRPLPVDLALRVGRRAGRRRARPPAQGTGMGIKTLSHGGHVIAFIGGDGAGKSTAVKAVFDVLAGQFRVAMIHMGKPPRSLLSRIVRRLTRSFDLKTSGGWSPPWSDDPGAAPGRVPLLLNVLLARDRRRQAFRARSLADAGWLVLSDRYPLHELKTMDSPRNGRIAERFPGAYARRMAQVESRYYDSLPEPDLRIVFRVSPEVAVSRRPEQDREFVSVRAREVAEVEWDSAVMLEAEGTPEEVHRAAIDALWRFLVSNRRKSEEG